MLAPKRALPRFVRVLGRPPVARREIGAIFPGPTLVSETFGPPEAKTRKRSSVVFWNFTGEDGRGGLTLVAVLHDGKSFDPDEVPIRVRATKNARTFHQWVLDRLCAVENGDEAPLFIRADSHLIKRVRS